MKPHPTILLLGVALIAMGAAGTIYYETLPGLVIKHPITGATTATINGTNGTVTAGDLYITSLSNTMPVVDSTGHFISGGAPMWTNLPPLTDMEGGTVYGTVSLNPLSSGLLQIQANYLTNFYGGVSPIISLGYPPIDPGFAIGNSDIITVGYLNLSNASLTNSEEMFVIGYSIGDRAVVTNAYELYGLGDEVFRLSSIDSSGQIYALGHLAASESALTNSSELYFLGTGAGSHSVIIDSGDIYGIGGDIHLNLATKSHVFVIGTGGNATNSNDFVFGDSAYNYFFPGASARFDNSVTSAGTVSANAGLVTNNIGAILSVGSLTYVDMTKASQTNSVSGAMTISYATNGIDAVSYVAERWFFNSSGSDQPVTFPVIASGVNGWRTNCFSPVPTYFTNGTITRVLLSCGGPTGSAALQTNCCVSFEYYK